MCRLVVAGTLWWWLGGEKMVWLGLSISVTCTVLPDKNFAYLSYPRLDVHNAMLVYVSPNIPR